MSRRPVNPGLVRRWAELARELEFSQLALLRKQAEGWRNGLIGLTALVTVLAVLKGRDDLSKLPSPWQTIAISLLGSAFLLLVAGSLLAVRASFGKPGERTFLAGQALRTWTQAEIGRVRRALHLSAVAFALGMLLVVGALAASWTHTEEPAADLVKVAATTGDFCGQLVSYTPSNVTLLSTTGDTAQPLILRTSDVRKIIPAPSC
ncbi:hypothetical protein ACOT81_43600 [Streptomyces sp. WI04-05B]|uniref:hypothetical protein n=1 Tax=Streptomyces TaxID=1883 RepID=UPI0029B358FF|nr:MULTISPECIES: hypothetical protein [unclassified Streptomyces]MDX2543297.1 hypothetical protein [Streptomyces sp. WI04-05B]MDX2586699.1 hypothetical protein [Streptomyces sp. WI04-05A]MDX3748405.1 hypothetical protein [Streptomyces sp. AK08-02]